MSAVEHSLTVAVGEDLVRSTGDAVTFGRRADIVVDEANRFLHRVVGRFVLRDEMWWLQNHSRHNELVLESMDTGSRLSVAAGGQFPVPGGSFVVCFGAGKANYELDCWTCTRVDSGVVWAADSVSGDGTLEFGRIPLTAEQHLLCVALASERLQGRHGLPSNLETAAMLGWSITKFNRKLDYVCGKFAGSGVRGLRGDRSGLAQDRRSVLVAHVVAQQLVTADDLGLLDHCREASA